MNEVQVYEAMPLSAPQIQAQVNLIQEVMKSVMKDGEHYGKIPGCGDKPSLLKPGAEKLMFTFRLVADPEVEVFELYHPTVQGHREYRVKVKISSLNGTYMGGGIGSCSTMESKYRFRGGEKIATDTPVPKNYWNLKNEGKIDDAKQLIGGEGFGVAKINGTWMICEIGEKQEHDNPADFYNTCEKMAKKRALVDATLTVTAASDIFTQDIEEMAENGVAPKQDAKQPDKPPIQQPQKKADIKDPDSPATEPQLKAIHTILGKLGFKTDNEKNIKVSEILGLNDVLESMTIISKGAASKVIEILAAEGTK